MRRTAASLALMLLAGSGAVLAQDADPKAGAVPSYTATEKWPAPEPVRNGMSAIRSLVILNHSLITHRRMPAAHSKRFGSTIKDYVRTIRESSDLASEADKALEALLTQIWSGAEAVGGERPGVEALDGIAEIDSGLAAYERQFDDPDWQPLR